MKFIYHLEFPQNDAGTDYITSDIHGNYTLLMDHLERLGFNFTTDRLFSVGDIIDRGQESEKCLDLLREPWFKPVLGNHEMMLASLLDNSSNIDQIRQSGGGWIDKYLDSPSTIRRWTELIKLRMPVAITIKTNFGTVGITHAQALVDWEEVRKGGFDIIPILTSRSQITNPTNDFVKNITFTIHGHTNVIKPTLISNRFWIDTIENTSQLCIMTLEQLENELNNAKR